MPAAPTELATHFLLVHSPLLSNLCWTPLAPCLEAAGYGVTAVALDNQAARAESLYHYHLRLIHSALANLQAQKVVVVGHSGAGSLLAALNPAQLSAYVFLDAIFPLIDASRFDLFDDPGAVQAWRDLAAKHQGLLPQQMLTRFGEQIKDKQVRDALVASIGDAPIALYEELMPVHPNWPPASSSNSPGLFVQWSSSYAQDAERAARVGFEVVVGAGVHLEMLNQPDKVARLLIEFVGRRLSRP